MNGKDVIWAVAGIALATFAISFIRRRAARTETTLDDDFVEAVDDGVDTIKRAAGFPVEEEEDNEP